MKKIINFFKDNSLLSLILGFCLWVNFLPLSNENTVIVQQYTPLETRIPNQKALWISGGDEFLTPPRGDKGYNY